MSDNSHSRLSASQASRWMVCPGSVALLAQIPGEPKTSKYAAEGTAAHALGETCIMLGSNALDFIGEEIEGFEVTEEMAEAVQVYVDFVNAIAPQQRISSGEIQLYLEKPFSLESVHKDISGTSDCVALYFEKGKATSLVVADYKHGAGVPVDAEGNVQLMIYALGAYLSLEEAVRKTIKSIRLVIVQPRASGEDVKEWYITPKELTKWAEETLKPAAEAVDKPGAVLCAGEKQCRFCDAMGLCPEHLNRAVEVAKTEFASNPILPPVESLTIDEMVKVMDFIQMLSPWADNVQACLHRFAESGTAIPGYKLVAKRSNRVWRNKEEAAAVMEEALGEAAYSRKLLSPSQAEKALGKNNPALESLWEKPDNGLVLVPESDKRQAVMGSLASDFIDSLDIFN